MKKIIGGVAVLLIGGLIFWWRSSAPQVALDEFTVDRRAEEVKQSTTPPPVRAQQDSATTPERLRPSENLRPLEEGEEADLQLAIEDLEKLEEVFDEVEARWVSSMKELFVDYGLPEETFKRYQELREDYDIAKLEAYEAYYEKMEAAQADEATFRLTLAEEQLDAPIQAAYEERMLQLLGEEAYRGYLAHRDQFNHELRLSSESQLPLFLIDL